MKPEEITSEDLIKLIRDNSIKKVQDLLNKSNIEETLAYIKNITGKPYGYIVLDSYSKEEILQRFDEDQKFYEALFLTETEFSKYIRLRFLTKLSVKNEVIGRTNYQVSVEILMETVRNNGILKKPKRSVETVDKAELRQKIIDAHSIDDLVAELGITVSILHRIISERFEDETYLEIKLSNEFKSEEDLRARIDKTEKLSDLADDLNIGTIPLSLYIKKRLKGETFSQIKFKGLTEERMEELFSKSNTKAKIYNFLKIICGLGREDAEKLLTERYGEDWEAKLSAAGAALKQVIKQAGKKRREPDKESKTPGTMPPEPPAAAERPKVRSRTTTRTTPMWQPILKDKEPESVPKSKIDNEEFLKDPIWDEMCAYIEKR